MVMSRWWQMAGRVLHPVPVLGDKTDILGQGLEVVEGDAVKIVGDGDGLVCIAQARPGGLLLDHGRLRRRGADRLCVGHQVDEGVAPRRRRGAAGGDVLLIFKAGGPPMGVQVDKGGQDGQPAGVQDRLVGAGQGRKPPAHRLDGAAAEIKLDRLTAGVDCVLDEHGVSSFGQPRRRRRAGRGQKKTFPQKREKFSFQKRGTDRLRKNRRQSTSSAFQARARTAWHSSPFAWSCRYFIIEAQKVSMAYRRFFVKSRAAVPVNF